MESMFCCEYDSGLRIIFAVAIQIYKDKKKVERHKEIAFRFSS